MHRMASGFEPCATGQPVDKPARSLSVKSLCGPMMRVIASAIWRCNSVVGHPVPTWEVAGSIPVLNDLVRSLSTNNAESRCRAQLDALVCLPRVETFTTGRSIGLSFITTWSLVQIQPPAPTFAPRATAWRARRRRSSVVEHVNPSSFLIRRIF